MTDSNKSDRRAQCSPTDAQGCTQDILPMLAVLTLGIGVGAASGPMLKSIGVWLFLVGCLVHAWCFVRTRIASSVWSQGRTTWVTILDIASWIAIAVAAAAVIAAGLNLDDVKASGPPVLRQAFWDDECAHVALFHRERFFILQPVSRTTHVL